MSLRAFLRLIAGSALLFPTAACNGATVDGGDTPECVAVVPPPIVTEARVLRLDVVELGETREYYDVPGGQSSRARASGYGYDLDAHCSDVRKRDSLSCGAAKGTYTHSPTDFDGGIDNAFGKHLLSYLQTLYEKPSRSLSTFSYLETQQDGRGTLYLGSKDGVQFVLPLVDVRLSAPEGDGLVTLAAVAPRDVLVASVREHANLAFGKENCVGSFVESVVDVIKGSADLPLSGAPNPDVECDGISIALRFAGSPVTAPPALPAGCPPAM